MLHPNKRLHFFCMSIFTIISAPHKSLNRHTQAAILKKPKHVFFSKEYEKETVSRIVMYCPNKFVPRIVLSVQMHHMFNNGGKSSACVCFDTSFVPKFEEAAFKQEGHLHLLPSCLYFKQTDPYSCPLNKPVQQDDA